MPPVTVQTFYGSESSNSFELSTGLLTKAKVDGGAVLAQGLDVAILVVEFARPDQARDDAQPFVGELA